MELCINSYHSFITYSDVTKFANNDIRIEEVALHYIIEKGRILGRLAYNEKYGLSSLDTFITGDILKLTPFSTREDLVF